MRLSLRKLAVWLLSALAVLAVCLLALELLGADCASRGNNPMTLDNDETCNGLGDAQKFLGLAVLALCALLFVAAIVGVVFTCARRLRPRR